MNKIYSIALGLSLLISCSAIKDGKEVINGVSWVAPSKPVGIESMQHVEKVAANWVCIMPFAFSSPDEQFVRFDNSRQWWGERSDGVKKCINYAQKLGHKVMLKPQVWFSHGFFTGNYDAGSEKNWQEFEKNYSKYILSYAGLADSMQVDIFCIGTEMKFFALNRPQYWRRLIQEVKEIYKGKLTYAANWDSYKFISFWDELDYIGVDAYFPITDNPYPSNDEIEESWQNWADEIATIQEKFKKPVIFTEYGYRSSSFALEEPWNSDYGGKTNMEIQSRAYQAMFKVMDQYEWFLGGFLWKWFSDYEEAGGESNNRFTPQNKPAESIIKMIHINRLNE